MTRYDFSFDPRFRRPLRLLGVRPDTAWVEVTPDRLTVRFGPWGVETPTSNVTGASVTGPHRAFKALGPRLSLADRGLTFGTNADRMVCIEFDQPVRGLEPFGLLRHPGLSVSVTDPVALADELHPAR